MTSEVTQADRKAIDRAEAFAKSKHTTPDEHDDIMVAVRLARLTAQSGEGRALPWLSKLLRYHETGGHEGDGSDHAMRNAPTELDAIVSGEGRSGAGEDGLQLARGIVEADLADAKEHCDADWIGLSQTALDAIDAALNARQSGEGEREAIKALRRDEVQRLGAAISLRSWHQVGTAYAQIRDKIDSWQIEWHQAALRATDEGSK